MLALAFVLLSETAVVAVPHDVLRLVLTRRLQSVAEIAIVVVLLDHT